MYYSEELEKTLNQCNPPLTLKGQKEGYISIISGRCSAVNQDCMSCVFSRGNNVGNICPSSNVVVSWPQYYPDIVKQFPELLL